MSAVQVMSMPGPEMFKKNRTEGAGIKDEIKQSIDYGVL
jgi:hypothetical protein